MPVVTAAAAAVFAFGTAIFFVLSSIERPVLGQALGRSGATPSPGDVRFVHESLKRLTPALPPANGFVLVVGTLLLVVQGVDRGWDAWAVAGPVFLWSIQAWIILVQGIADDVRRVRETPSDGDLDAVSHNVTMLVHQHLTGLAANLGVVIIQLSLLAR